MCFNLDLLKPVVGPCGLFACGSSLTLISGDTMVHSECGFQRVVTVASVCACLSHCRHVNVNNNSITTLKKTGLPPLLTKCSASDVLVLKDILSVQHFKERATSGHTSMNSFICSYTKQAVYTRNVISPCNSLKRMTECA